ncbi:MAG: hypothetical protein H7X99_00185 [Saprospiraceae bacterium]|nr:hypothetical protein [Saprospiraceae bacterium]
MRNEENNLLAIWLEGKFTDQNLKIISESYDLENLEHNLSLLEQLAITNKPTNKNWQEFTTLIHLKAVEV